MKGFNPCFNGTMYKNCFTGQFFLFIYSRFNPCFNGTMYKNGLNDEEWNWLVSVSILVLMELCIKTD